MMKDERGVMNKAILIHPSALLIHSFPKSIVAIRVGCSAKQGPGVAASTLNQFTAKET